MAFRIFFIITDLNTGGAEMMLYKFLRRIDRNIFSPEVVSLTGLGSLASEFEAIKVPVHDIGMQRGIPNPRGVYRLSRMLLRSKPDMVQTWMYHADLIGSLATKLAGKIPIAWNIRNSNLASGLSKRTTLWTVQACARLSHVLPKKIICCSEVARKIHEDMGYCASKMVLIPNGFDLTVFRPDAEARRGLFEELAIPADALLIGCVARYDPQKDHATFVRAAALLRMRFPGTRFVLCGDGISWENGELSRLIRNAGLQDVFYLLGRRKDVARITAAFDIATSSSSYGEAFSNVIGEAMACGVPSAVTDVGDSPFIVGDTGKVVPPGAPEALANAWAELVEIGREGRGALGRRARDRILNNFALDAIVSRYENLYREILDV